MAETHSPSGSPTPRYRIGMRVYEARFPRRTLLKFSVNKASKPPHYVEYEFNQQREANKHVPHHGDPLDEHLRILFLSL